MSANRSWRSPGETGMKPVVDVPGSKLPFPVRVIREGHNQDPPEERELRAGPISVLYSNGHLRNLRHGHQELVRSIYVALRDRNWDTVAAVLSDECIQSTPDSFEVSYVASHRAGEIDFQWQGRIQGHKDGSILFSMEGEARTDFQTNRIGFCLLHPDFCAGTPIAIEAPDGTVRTGTFPAMISPHQPFENIQSMRWDGGHKMEARIDFAGEVFEMEDQRNWTDASFKTYCPPLELPFPRAVEAGDRIRQSVRFSIAGNQARAIGAKKTVELVPAGNGRSPQRLPEIGLGMASHGGPLSDREAGILASLRPGHLRVDLDLAKKPGEWEELLVTASRDSEKISCDLLPAVFLDDAWGSSLAALLGLLKKLRPPLRRFMVFEGRKKPVDAKVLADVKSRLHHMFPEVLVGTGTDAYFAEFNRQRPSAGSADFLSYSLNPQVHAFDSLSLVETLAVQATTLDCARELSGGKGVWVSPVTFKPRWNPNATGVEPEVGTNGLPVQVDLRQMSLFGGSWTLGSLKYLAETGAEGITYYETTGWRGVMETDGNITRPGLFHSVPGMVFPLYHVLADVLEFRNGEVLPLISTDPLLVAGMRLRNADGSERILAANLSDQFQDVHIHAKGGCIKVRTLDEESAARAMLEPELFRADAGATLSPDGGPLKIRLMPLAVARVDIT